ncbi:hypothetical protein [Clostridium estertheticum]|uniref:hypothetical protein n=1 Tax=Clostridium estertheticum TaxID=238834 RepID=UPI001CF5228E|nr:hypothetical protein [Clostridium estertheticum]MCB2362276.1 hypothetical protein [Clostridium estertheticum]
MLIINDKVINLNIKKNYRDKFRFRVEIVKGQYQRKGGEVEITENVLILISQTQDRVERGRVHPITSFLYRRFSKSYTQKQEAYYITSFLNWVLIENKSIFEIEDIYDLQFNHGIEYLNEYGKSVEKETLKRCDRVLTQLYYYLAQKEVLKNIHIDSFEFIDKNKGIIKSPFQGIIYPSIKDKAVLHNLPRGVLSLFIDTAIMETPEIALGVYMQCFGGLRIGEIVNVVKSAISLKGAFGEYGMVIDLRDRYLRKELKHFRSGGGVKKPRKQVVFPYFAGMLKKIYKFHIENFQCDDDTSAVFVDRNGHAMTDVTYRYHFNKLKNKFIDRLLSSNDIVLKTMGLDLQSKKWSSHIGRGIFSNMIANVSTNIAQIAQARGDVSLQSSLVYLSDSEQMAKLLYENETSMWDELIKSVNLKEV